MYAGETDPRNIVPLVMKPDDARYNARDVLGMCRAYLALAPALHKTNTLAVYDLDRSLARIALQMKRAGLPVDMNARVHVRGILVELRDKALTTLLPYTQDTHFEAFVDWVAKFQATSVRKGENVGGSIDSTGMPMSNEGALLERATLRKQEFLAGLEKSALRQAIWEWIKYQAFAHQPCTIDGLATLLQQERAPIASTLRSYTTRGFVVEALDGSFTPAPIVDEDLVADCIGGINIGSKIQQAAILRVAGVPLLQMTEKTGLPKIDKETLESVAYHEVARALLKYTLTASAVNNFIDGIEPVDIAQASDGRHYGVIHADWMVHKITGRWGSSPNCQNWSKRAGGGAANVREMIAAPPGEILIGADYAQLEARLLAAMSQDPFLLDIFQNDRDIHTQFGVLAFPREFPSLVTTYNMHKGHACGPNPADPKSKCKDCKRRDKLRDLTKRLEYGGFYGGSVDTLWLSVVKDEPDLEIAVVRAFLIEVNRTCQGLRLFQKKMLDYTIQQGEIRSPILGRRQVFPMGRVDPTVVSNFPNQSGGADFWGIGAVRFAQRYDQSAPVGSAPRLIHNGHDSVLVRAPEAQAQEVKDAIIACWTHEWNGVKFPVDVDIGRRWSDT